MRYTVRKSIVEIAGGIWWPMGATCALTKTLSAHDVDNIRDRVEPGITRANVEDWLGCNAGDFSSVQDFHASLEDGERTVEIPWATEDGELAFCDCTCDD